MRFATLLLMAMIFSAASTAKAQLNINFNPADGTPQFVLDGFNEAADLWESTLGDVVTVNIDVDYRSISGGAIGITTPTVGTELYADFRAALVGDAKSAADFSSTASLQAGPIYSVWSNLSAENPNGAGSETPYLDDGTLGPINNLFVLETSANARAIGIATPPGIVDGSITFNSDAPWDFDRSNGISASAFDFVGVAAHEIAHVLGFTSGVDNIDASPGASENTNEFLSNALDLFRFSAESLAQGAGVIDMTASPTEKFFSIDGGTTNLAGFSKGVNFGGLGSQQASHWADNLGLGMMDPSAFLGELLVMSELDRTGMDVIGWDLAEPIPEPGTVVLLMFGISGLALRRSRR